MPSIALDVHVGKGNVGSRAGVICEFHCAVIKWPRLDGWSRRELDPASA